VRDNNEMPGHLARRFQQIAVAVFLAEVGGAGFDLTPFSTRRWRRSNSTRASIRSRSPA
jgi:hypothetical protein